MRDRQVLLSWRHFSGDLLDAAHAIRRVKTASCKLEWKADRGPLQREVWWVDRARGLAVSSAPEGWFERNRTSATWRFRCPALGVDSWSVGYDLAPLFAPDQPPSHVPGRNDYVYVEELPQAIEKVRPRLPEAVIRQRITGTVVIKAFVDTDGRVDSTVVVRSVPALDQAVLDAVKQWRFKPARTNGRPVAVWVAVPVKISN